MIFDKDKAVYISGKISGLTRKQYLENFQKAEEELRAQGYIPVNPAKVCDALPPGMPWGCYMDIALDMLKHCRKIYMLNNWMTSKGATLEMLYARGKGFEIIHQSVMEEQE